MNKCEIVAHSVDKHGNELLSVLVTFPRIILAEINTHKMLSKNTSSSRAIPALKMIEVVEENPFIPFAWQKIHSGMQGVEYFNLPTDLAQLEEGWLEARDAALEYSSSLNHGGLTKQLTNRLLEPFMWTTMLITGNVKAGGWLNFFELRCPMYENNAGIFWKSRKDFLDENSYAKDFTEQDWRDRNKSQAEIHIQDIAEKIFDALNESTPKELKPGEWHIPFIDKLDKFKLAKYAEAHHYTTSGTKSVKLSKIMDVAVKVSTAMAARTSYTVVGNEKEIDYEKQIKLHDDLLAQNPPHSSPMEHCALCMTDFEYVNYSRVVDVDEETDSTTVEFGWCKNFKGFIPYRHIVERKTT